MSGSYLDSKKILMVVAQEGFRDEEFFEPLDLFEDMGISITIASKTTDDATGALGGTVKPDVPIDKVIISDFDAIVISGGSGSRKLLWPDKKLQKLVADAFEHEKIVAAICVSPVILARAGVLEGKKATVFKDPACIKELEKGGAIYEDADVIVTDNIITARDPASAEKFGEAVIEALGSL
ncbi:DJ-1/PfpI/YhbO family deglycase/protease [Methanolobus psychrotolerans]|uniref:DJ-1/PfpI/YhbO family deglycase/protease n=1 Tax=Methanolobus psychrotolerans TaxID=1874706 RepID=UPI000B91A1CC|nr:DJ-1/PfpI/YhbO family deglycase/protease [Methanolobus psychrotolerans]